MEKKLKTLRVIKIDGPSEHGQYLSDVLIAEGFAITHVVVLNHWSSGDWAGRQTRIWFIEERRNAWSRVLQVLPGGGLRCVGVMSPEKINRLDRHLTADTDGGNVVGAAVRHDRGEGYFDPLHW